MYKRLPQNGFTVIELLIATTVFSVFLFLLAAMTLRIGQLYYRGISASKTQEAARSISSSISRSIQFSSSSVSSDNSSYICAGNDRYSFITGKQLTDIPSQVGANSRVLHVLVQDSPTTCTGAAAINPGPIAASQRELMPANMRLAALSVTPAPVTGLYSIKVRIVYGDDDLLCSPTAGDCAATTTSTNLGAADLSCKGNKPGTQFCAVAELTTTVQKRL